VERSCHSLIESPDESSNENGALLGAIRGYDVFCWNVRPSRVAQRRSNPICLMTILGSCRPVAAMEHRCAYIERDDREGSKRASKDGSSFEEEEGNWAGD
jgi:hypothetical protein